MGKPKNFEKSQHCWMSYWRGTIDDRVTCPYNPKHVMSYKSLIIHIIKCAQKNPELAAQFETCPYNTLHRGPKDDFLKDHLKECQDHEMFVLSRVTRGKEPYVEVYSPTGAVPKVVITPSEKTEEMLQLEIEWKEML